MGKDSLIKSTTKKADADTDKEEAKQKATAKKSAPKKKAKAKRSQPKKTPKTAKKAAAKKKAPKRKAKKAAAPKAKAAAKSRPVKQPAKKKAAAKPTPAKKPAPPKKKPSIKELLMKKFDSQLPVKGSGPAPATRPKDAFSAPPFFAGLSDDENKRLKALLLKKFDLEAAPAQPAPVSSETETEPAAPAPVTTEPAVSAEPHALETQAAEPPDEIPPPIAEEPADPAEKMLKYLAGAFAFLVVLVIGASFVNQGRYYLSSADGAVEIWQGKFAPKGQKLLVALPGAELPETAPGVYTKKDVFPIAFNYYIDKADAILDVPGAPDFDEVKAYLDKALAYAVTQDLRDIARARINYIDLLILMYKADVAASRGTITSLEAALDFLAEAKHLATDLQVQQIDQKMEAYDASLASLKAARKEAEQLEADRQKLEQAQGAHQE